jgi:preprotein translocase subunit Sec63
MGDALTILILITGVLVLGRTAVVVYNWWRFTRRARRLGIHPVQPEEWWGKR